MIKKFRNYLVGLLTLVAFFIATTLLALEAGSVVTVETKTSSNALRRTHIWFVATHNALYLEAGNPQNPWVQDLRSTSSLHLVGAGLDGEYAFAVYVEPVEHEKIRNLMRAKYGWRDWWVDMLFDTSQSALVRLHEQ